MSSSVSVVMAVFNGSRFLRQQVDSVLAQLEGEDELVIVDDASTDDSLKLLRAIDSPRIKIYCNEVNSGVRLTFQRGLQLARHEIIFLCDQDDVWLPGKRNAFVAAFSAQPSAAVVLSDAEVIDAQGAVVSTSFMQSARGKFDGSICGTLWRNRYLGCAMAIHRRILPGALPIPVGA